MYCSTCRQDKDEGDFAPAQIAKHAEKGYAICRSCKKIQDDKYSKTEKGKASHKRAKSKKKSQYREYWKTHDPYADTSTKQCSNCKEVLPRSMFDRQRDNKDGLNVQCRVCEHFKYKRYKQQNLAKVLLTRAHQRAMKKGVPYSITVDDISIPDFCPILHIPLYSSTGQASPNSPSLDRIDPKLGYVPGNVQVISCRANMLKNDASIEELELLIAYLKDLRANTHEAA